MTNIKCLQCGTLNLVADEMCKACGVELQPLVRVEEPASPAQEEPPATYRFASPLIGSFFGPGSVLGPTWELWKNNLWLITKIVFVIMAPFEILKALSATRTEDTQLAIGVVALQYLCNVLVVPALFYALVKVMETGTAPGVNEAYRWGLGKIPKLALAAIMTAVATGLGTLLCIIPGIIVAMVLFLVYPIAVFEKGSAYNALERSANLTKGHRWNIFAASLVVGIVSGIFLMVASGLNALFLFYGPVLIPLQAAAALVADIVAEAGTVLTLVVYLSILRTLESGYTE